MKKTQTCTQLLKKSLEERRFIRENWQEESKI